MAPAASPTIVQGRFLNIRFLLMFLLADEFLFDRVLEILVSFRS
jgi:hypothetical protein